MISPYAKDVLVRLIWIGVGVDRTGVSVGGVVGVCEGIGVLGRVAEVV